MTETHGCLSLWNVIYSSGQDKSLQTSHIILNKPLSNNRSVDFWILECEVPIFLPSNQENRHINKTARPDHDDFNTMMQSKFRLPFVRALPWHMTQQCGFWKKFQDFLKPKSGLHRRIIYSLTLHTNNIRAPMWGFNGQLPWNFTHDPLTWVLSLLQ